ncbi:oleate activated transcription factor 3 [Fusarium circinatum]|uniref:Orotidine 5'-phosphate decarboxylase n=1 Tax=Fusarium circinatum TaxID=48490 RepID=A0A8H5STH6_FUSCI|nr:oleate activated transcription factor 3 [Fusarium circinatum]
MSTHPTLKATFASRAETATHPLSRHLYKLMDLKVSNLCLSADVATARELLYFADKIGPSIVVLKTHYDMVAGWDFDPRTGTGARLASLARKHGFLIFEDRKFGDIGNTVELQYTSGAARIIEWAHITNVNMVPGKASVASLAHAASRWLERYHYEVKTSISIGTPTASQLDEDSERSDNENQNDTPEPARAESGRKGSIVSTTTVTQQYESADSPRLVKTIPEGDETVFPGIDEAPIERGLLILAQMSSQGNFMNKEYTQACVEAAREHKNFVMGFVSQECLNTEPEDDFIHMTPGCQLPPEGADENEAIKGDGKGQQYNTPQKIIGIAGADIAIVGRGIIKASDPEEEAERYRSAAWKAYMERCDREQPCGNCKSRNKESACVYETGAPTVKQSKQATKASPTYSDTLAKQAEPSPPQSVDSSNERLDEPLSSKVADWGYAHNGASTMGILKRIETLTDVKDEPPDLTSHGSSRGSPGKELALREKYKALIRQLPARNYIEKLVEMYMRGFNWQYYPIDPDIFYAQLDEWNSLPFSVFSDVGPRGLNPELRAFPAVVFQIIATALLLLPEKPDSTFDSLKFAGGMRFEDLAVEYSESGQAVLDLLGKKNLSLSTVQAQFLRASFHKFTAKVTDAWHTIAIAIRDAQDLGMHRDSLDPRPKDASVESILENQWLIQRRRRIYILLSIWDLNCAMILGRPGTVDGNQTLPTPPVDAPIPQDRTKMPVVPRSEDDHPTPITRLLWNYELCGPLRAVQNLEVGGSYPMDPAKIDEIHQCILNLDKKIPASFRMENPDTRWDHLPEAHWYPANRFYFASLHEFSKMALHRPFIFNRLESRVEAIHASLKTLEIQKMTFEGLPPDSWRNFMLFFASFDAIVLLASVYILFPREHTEYTDKTIEHFQWTIERFSAIQERNPLAKSAQGVLRAIVARFKRAMNKAHAGSLPSLAPSSSEGSIKANTDSTPGSSSLGSSEFPELDSTWIIPSVDNLNAMAPFFPTGDLVYNDLTAGPGMAMLPLPMEGGQGDIGNYSMWQFGGGWGDDTVWQMLNQFPAATDGSIPDII